MVPLIADMSPDGEIPHTLVASSTSENRFLEFFFRLSAEIRPSWREKRPGSPITGRGGPESHPLRDAETAEDRVGVSRLGDWKSPAE